jgi:ubiquinone/menaquinone biosynthesis C-methylase UbiE
VHKDYLPVDNELIATASTPDLWAAAFAASRRYGPSTRLQLSMTAEWSIIKRYVENGAALLDAGCGDGSWVEFLREKGYAAEGLDSSPALVERLRASYPEAQWTEGDIRHMPYPDSRFDAVVSWGVIEHDEAGPAAALLEIFRVLKAGGVTIVTVPLDTPAQRRSAAILRHRPGAAHAFFQYLMTIDELKTELRNSGFEVIDAAPLRGTALQIVAPRLSARLHGLPFRAANFLASKLFGRVPGLSVMTYCVARKPADVSL